MKCWSCGEDVEVKELRFVEHWPKGTRGMCGASNLLVSYLL